MPSSFNHQQPPRYSRILAWAVVVMVLSGWLTGNVSAQVIERLRAFGNVKSLDSHSGQFVVLGATSEIYVPTPDGGPAPTNCVRLDPGIVVFTCERVKEDLLRLFHAKDVWRGQITVTLRADFRTDGPMVVNSIWARDGWRYQVVLPYYIDPTKLVRAAVRSLLLEMANRNNPTPNLADIPLWMQEGLAHELLVEDTTSVVIVSRSRIPVEKYGKEPLQMARDQMKGHTPISFSDLSLPLESQLSGPGWDNYCANAHLFVAELLAMKNGPERIQESLRRMHDFLNPQFAFQAAFSNDFRNALAVEKWWSLAALNLADRDQFRHWSPAMVVQRLDEIFRVQVAVRMATNAVPARRDVSLSEFLDKADYSSQRIVLPQINAQLETLLLSCPPDMGKIVNDYRVALAGYLQKREIAPRNAWADKKDLIKAIKILDVIRDDLRHYDPAVTKAVVQTKAGS